jgi:hypothetical protein
VLSVLVRTAAGTLIEVWLQEDRADGAREIRPAGDPDGDMKIGKSLRLPVVMFAQISAVAERRRTSWSALVRQWIAEGLTRDSEVDPDPVVELHHHLAAAARALRALEGRRNAA